MGTLAEAATHSRWTGGDGAAGLRPSTRRGLRRRLGLEGELGRAGTGCGEHAGELRLAETLTRSHEGAHDCAHA